MLTIDEINKLKQENAELKAYMDVNEDFKAAWEELKAENDKLKDEITELEEKFLTLNCKSYSYYLTLQEIKEIAERCFNNSQCNCGLKADIEQILQRITKAESEG